MKQVKKVVSFSGGRTSAYLCYLMIENFGVENVDIVYMDTGFEHPSTYDFIRNCAKWLKSPITFLRGDFSRPIGAGVGYNIVGVNDIGCDGKPFAEMMKKYGTPYIGGMFCTDRMKLKPFKKYCDDKYGKGGYETWLGIRSDEPARIFNPFLASKLKSRGFPQYLFEDILRWANEDNMLSKVRISNHGIDDILEDLKVAAKKTNVRYLAELGEIEKQDVLDFWKEMPFDLGIEEHLGNCVFCPKKSNLKLAAAQRDEPELYIKWLDMLYSDSVRVDEKTGHWSKMYRGNQSLEQLIATFDGSTGEEIKARIRGTKATNSGSCSESCEVFNCQLDWVDEIQQ